MAFGFGTYALAPGGAYLDATAQGISRDWHSYLWVFDTPPELWLLIALLAPEIGVVVAIYSVPIACVATALLVWIAPAFTLRLTGTKPLYLALVAIALGIISGILFTIVMGRNPGVA